MGGGRRGRGSRLKEIYLPRAPAEANLSYKSGAYFGAALLSWEASRKSQSLYYYSRTSMARTPMAHLQRLFRTLFESLGKKS